MAGGPYAKLLPCYVCGERAVRIVEGADEDHYKCEEGHKFQIAWAKSGAPTEPQWPPSKEMELVLAKMGNLGAD